MKPRSLVLICAIAFSTMVLSASTMPQSNRAKKEMKENSLTGGNDLSNVSSNVITPLDMIEPILVETPKPYAVYGAEWKAFGPINTKYHAKWLFNPIKLC